MEFWNLSYAVENSSHLWMADADRTNSILESRQDLQLPQPECGAAIAVTATSAAFLLFIAAAFSGFLAPSVLLCNSFCNISTTSGRKSHRTKSSRIFTTSFTSIEASTEELDRQFTLVNENLKSFRSINDDHWDRQTISFYNNSCLWPCSRGLYSTILSAILLAGGAVSITGTVLGAVAAGVTCSTANSGVDDNDLPDITILELGSRVPLNTLPIPVLSAVANMVNDGCGDAGIRFTDGRCYPLLQRGPCGPTDWLTVDPRTLSAVCGRRLCGLGQAFIGRDGLCNDIFDPVECLGGRRLFYTAFGDPICDCPVGQYPFPTANSDCVPLFTRGPCLPGQVVGFTASGSLGCVRDECGVQSAGGQFVRNPADGFCYALGTRGPCDSSRLYSYDVFRAGVVCTEVLSRLSPYRISEAEARQINQIYPQFPVDHPDYLVILQSPADAAQRRNVSDWDRQDAEVTDNSAGILQFPMLVPCRPGARVQNNFKCTNPQVPMARPGSLRRAQRPVVQCQEGFVLIATGECRRGAPLGAATCGPSFMFVQALNECRQSQTGSALR